MLSGWRIFMRQLGRLVCNRFREKRGRKDAFGNEEGVVGSEGQVPLDVKSEKKSCGFDKKAITLHIE